MPKCVVLLAVAVVLFAAPTAARADGYVGPGIGIAFGNPSAQGLADFVFDASWLYQEPIGVELDMTYAPSFFGNQGAYGSNSVTTVMGNVMVAEREPGPPLPRGIHRGRTVRPYVSGGLGWIHEATAAVSRTDLGTDLGVGILSAGGGSVGVRGDLRYFRDLVGTSEGNTTNIDFGSFHFWRASITLLFRF